MNNLKEFSDKDLYELMMICFRTWYDYDYLGERKSLKLKFDLGGLLLTEDKVSEEGFYNLINEYQFSFEDLDTEFSFRKLERPLHIIPAPKTVIILPIKVDSKKSNIIVPDTVVVKDMEKYTDHPFQGVIVAMDKSIEWDALYVGAQVYLKSPQAEIFRFQGISYRYITYSSIIAVI